MYGMVNQAMKDLVVARFGEPVWNSITSKAGISSDDFELMQNYPDSVTYGLVGAASEQLSISAADLLEQFGEYWIRFTADKGYGDLLSLFGADFRSCLKNLNQMHARMGAMMPELQPPRFTVEEVSGNELRLSYFSKRPGLTPMVVGLLKGLASRHGEQISVETLPRAESADHETFLVKIQR